MNALGKIIMIYLFLAISITIWNPSIIFGNDVYGATFISMFPNQVQYNATSNQVYYPTGSNQQFQFNQTTESALGKLSETPNVANSGGLLNYADPILMIVGFFSILLKFVFSPIIFLFAVNAPIVFILMIGLPLVILFLWGLISFIRSGF